MYHGRSPSPVCFAAPTRLATRQSPSSMGLVPSVFFRRQPSTTSAKTKSGTSFAAKTDHSGPAPMLRRTAARLTASSSSERCSADALPNSASGDFSSAGDDATMTFATAATTLSASRVVWSFASPKSIRLSARCLANTRMATATPTAGPPMPIATSGQTPLTTSPTTTAIVPREATSQAELRSVTAWPLPTARPRQSPPHRRAAETLEVSSPGASS